MKAPLLVGLELSARGWFNLMFLLFTLTTVLLVVLHLRRPLAIVPRSWTGKGQLLYVFFLWAIVIGNFERALTQFHEQRLGTEGVIFAAALVATALLLWYTREEDEAPAPDPRRTFPWARAAWSGAAAMVALSFALAGTVHAIYGDRHDGWGGRNMRWGPEADWRVKPILKTQQHR